MLLAHYIHSALIQKQIKINKSISNSMNSYPFNGFLEKKEILLLKKLWCCVGGRDENKNLVLSNELIKVELPP